MDNFNLATFAVVDIIGDIFPDTPHLKLKCDVIRGLEKCIHEIKAKYHKEEQDKMIAKTKAKVRAIEEEEKLAEFQDLKNARDIEQEQTFRNSNNREE